MEDNERDQLIIRQSKKTQYFLVFGTGAGILWYFVGPYEKTRIMYANSPEFTILIGLIFFAMFFYFLRELILRQPEIILTREGIELRDQGFFEWGMMESFSTTYYRYSESRDERLILHFREFADLKFNISNLEKDKNEIAALILKWKGSSDVLFAGHNPN